MITSSLLALMIPTIMMSLASILSKKSHKDREKNSPFECGFDPKNSSRLPFSMQFFLITIIFIIFDVEIALIFPIIIIPLKSNLWIWAVSSMTFMLILIIGLYHEWNQGALEWKI